MKKKMNASISIKRLCVGISLCCMVTGAQASPTSGIIDQKFDVEISLDNTTLKHIVNNLKKQTNIVFSYDTSLESVQVNNVSIHVEDEDISSILKQVFKGTDIQFKVDDQMVVLYSKSNIHSLKANDSQQNSKKINGIVKDASGEPVIGANVIEKGTTNGVITNVNGEFELDIPQNALIVVSYIGYIPQEVNTTGQKSFTINLKEDLQKLDEIVVIGYGQMKKGDLSAAIANVANVEQLKERPVTSTAELLQGQVPGVTVMNNGGHPNSGPSIVIRGQGSRGGESPLYVVDGVPGAPINLNDVESITVLKDAASAAIYGAYSGSAGVILVTTKKPKKGKPSLTYQLVTGMSKASKLPQSLTIEQERAVRETALKASGNSLPDGWNVEKNPYIGTTRTDWIDEIFRTAPFQRHNVTLDAGNEEFSNRLSMEYSDKQGILENTYSKELSLRYTSSYTFNKYVRVREDLYWENYNSRGTDTSSGYSGVILAAMMMPRNTEVYDPYTGTFGGTAPSDPAYIDKYGSNYADIHGDAINPVRILKGDYKYDRSHILHTSTFLDIMEPVKGLNFTSRFTYKLNSGFYKGFSPRRLEPGKPNNMNTLNYNSSRSYDWSFENTLTYDRVFSGHNIGIMLSTTTTEYEGRGFAASAKDFISEDEFMNYFSQAGDFSEHATDWFSKDRNISAVGRLSYSWRDRYFVTGSIRRDYAGRLPVDKKYGDFPSVTGAWKITSEPFMPKTSFLNLLKIRASWGKIGNLGSIGYAYGRPLLNILTTTDGGQVGKDNPVVTGMYNGTAFNPFLTWETSEQLDFGLDANLLDNRLSISADYFNKRTYNLIKAKDSGWTSSIGISAMLINEGEIRNKGFELSVGWNDQVGNVAYYVSGNMATLKNEVYDIGAPDENGKKPVWIDNTSFRSTLYPYRTEEGLPLNSYWLIKTDGLFQTDQEAANYKNSDGKVIQPNAKAGDIKFIDQNGDGEINDDDRLFMGNSMPKLTYALSGGMSWKGFNFSIMFQGVQKAKLFNALKFITLNESQGNFNRSEEILDAFPATNKVPRISSSDANGNFTNQSDYYLEDGSYLRIKNITVGYSFTNIFKKNSYLHNRRSSLDLTMSIDNVCTITNYTGLDPEVGGIGMDGGQYPVPRVFSFGLKIRY